MLLNLQVLKQKDSVSIQRAFAVLRKLETEAAHQDTTLHLLIAHLSHLPDMFAQSDFCHVVLMQFLLVSSAAVVNKYILALRICVLPTTGLCYLILTYHCLLTIVRLLNCINPNNCFWDSSYYFPFIYWSIWLYLIKIIKINRLALDFLHSLTNVVSYDQLYLFFLVCPTSLTVRRRTSTVTPSVCCGPFTSASPLQHSLKSSTNSSPQLTLVQ